jgi:hypothetical protein
MDLPSAGWKGQYSVVVDEEGGDFDIDREETAHSA